MGHPLALTAGQSLVVTGAPVYLLPLR